MISLIHPTRSRHSQSDVTLNKWMSRVKYLGEVELIISCDRNDPELPLYQRIYYNWDFENGLLISDNMSAVDAINNAAKISTGNVLIVVSDDTDCPDNWDWYLEKYIKNKKDFIIKTSDGTQPWIITMPIMDRAYYNRFGYIYHPDYQHMFCDTELTCVADLTGRKLTSNILFKHNHYSVTKEAPDAISKRADGTWDQGEKLFLERYKRNFDLPADQIKGKIQDNGMINWLKRKIR